VLLTAFDATASACWTFVRH